MISSCPSREILPLFSRLFCLLFAEISKDAIHETHEQSFFGLFIKYFSIKTLRIACILHDLTHQFDQLWFLIQSSTQRFFMSKQGRYFISQLSKCYICTRLLFLLLQSSKFSFQCLQIKFRLLIQRYFLSSIPW